MNIWNFLKSTFNPEIISSFNDIYDCHYYALELYIRGGYSDPTLNGIYTRRKRAIWSLNKNMPYDDKEWIVNHRNEILEGYKQEIDFRKFRDKKNDIISASEKYPHAFVFLCKKYLGGIIDCSLYMPGYKVSKRSQRLEQEKIKKRKKEEKDIKDKKRLVVLSELCKAEEKNRPRFEKRGLTNEKIEELFESQRRYRLAQLDDSASDALAALLSTYTSKDTSGYPLRVSFFGKLISSVKELKDEDIIKLHDHISEFPSIEESLLKRINEEEISIKFDDLILENTKRAAYYTSFLKEKGRSCHDKEYCVRSISQLDLFIDECIQNRYKAVKIKYPKGLNIFEEKRSKNKEFIIDNIELIKLFEINANNYIFFKRWESLQKDYTAYCRELNAKINAGWGCCFYEIDFSTVDELGCKTSGEYRVWQSFIDSFCDIEGLEYSFYPSVREQAKINKDFLSNKQSYNENDYNKIFEYIQECKKRNKDIIP